MAISRGGGRGDDVLALLAATVLACAAPARDRDAREDLRGALRLPGDPTERRLIHAAIDRIVQAPLAREMAREFAGLGSQVDIEFVSFSEAHIEEYQGRKVLRGIPASVNFDSKNPRVRVNRLYLETEPGYARLELAKVLAHELLGHVLETLKARRAGVGAVYAGLVENETNASAVAWTVSVELGDPPNDPREGLFIKEPQEWWRRMRLDLPAYAVLLELAEYSNPFSALEGRRLEAVRQLERIDRHMAAIGAARSYIEHALERHEGQRLAGVVVDRSAFRWLEDVAARRSAQLARQRRHNVAIRQTIDLRLAYYRGEAGRAALALEQESIRSARGKEFLDRHAERLAALRSGLAKITLPSRPTAGSSRAPTGQVSWQALKLMCDEDLVADGPAIGGFSPSLTSEWGATSSPPFD